MKIKAQRLRAILSLIKMRTKKAALLKNLATKMDRREMMINILTVKTFQKPRVKLKYRVKIKRKRKNRSA
jgi:predicted component of type VI protein secretion system